MYQGQTKKSNYLRDALLFSRFCLTLRAFASVMPVQSSTSSLAWPYFALERLSDCRIRRGGNSQTYLSQLLHRCQNYMANSRIHLLAYLRNSECNVTFRVPKLRSPASNLISAYRNNQLQDVRCRFHEFGVSLIMASWRSGRNKTRYGSRGPGKVSCSLLTCAFPKSAKLVQ